jgi:4-hydroxy-3-polyprenylbenzoate decarboxylase
MSYPLRDLRDFIAVLEKHDELKIISEPVSADLEITEFYLREIACGEEGKALLFTSVDGSKIPVLINSMGSFRRLKLAFGGRSLEDISADLKSFVDLKPPQGWNAKMAKALQLSSLRKCFPRTVKKAACQEVVYTGDEIDLTQFPILKTWPQDGGKFITLPLVYTKNVDGSAKNCGMYRMQIYDKKTTGMHWQIHHDGSNFYSQFQKANKRMEVAVAIGTEPSLPFSSIAPLPPNVYEMLLAGFIRKSPVEMVKCKTVNIEVPAQAEIVLEGYVEPNELREEGPFGDHTGYYTLEEDYPVFHVTAITTRKNPIYMTTVVGRSPQEDCYFGGKATERIFLPLFQAIAHEVKDMLLPWDSCFHNGNIIAMEKSFPLHARRLMSQVWGQGQASTCKAIVTVDAETPLSDDEAMLRHILDRLDIKTGVYITQGIVDALDHSSYQWAYGGKIGLDVTTPLAGEPLFAAEKAAKRAIPISDADILAELNSDEKRVLGLRRYAEDLHNSVLLLAVDKENINTHLAARLSQRVFNSNIAKAFTIVVLVDHKNNDLLDDHKIMWRIFNNTDWERDTFFSADRRAMLIDSTAKVEADGFTRRWPDDLEIPESVKLTVDSKQSATRYRV